MIKLKTLLLKEIEYPLAGEDNLHSYGGMAGWKGKIIWMPPEQFLKLVLPLETKYQDKESMSNIEYRIKNGLPLDFLVLYVDMDKRKVIGHEGRHRATVAQKLGIKKVPVLIFTGSMFKRVPQWSPKDHSNVEKVGEFKPERLKENKIPYLYNMIKLKLLLKEIESDNIDYKISRLEQEWDKLDSTGTNLNRQHEISKELELLRKEKGKTLVNQDKAKNLFAQMRQSITEWISHGNAVNATPDSKLRATPGGQNDGKPGWDNAAPSWNDDVEGWDGIVEGKDWWGYIGENNWNKKQSHAAIYINENDKPHKMWIKIKTHGLRKPTDTNESYKERVRKHTKKVASSWMSEARKIHNNVELNEVGNPIPISWKQSFKEALNNPKVKSYLAETGAEDIDPVNFTSRK